jgi:hypothetical protein
VPLDESRLQRAKSWWGNIRGKNGQDFEQSNT